MNKLKLLVRIAMVLGIVGAAALLVFAIAHGGSIDILTPKGEIADKQRDLLVFVVYLSLVVVVPVFMLLGFISFKYRQGNKKAHYRPNWGHHNGLEAIWWGIPCAIIAVLAVITWITSHDLDPYKPLASTAEPVNVQVVSLQWKWLFIYPDLGVASVNELPLPVNRPINFTITSDAPMNSFWIPSLGGQIYAMSGMSTKLHLIADHEGTYKGSSANVSGEGFASMKFNAVVTSNKAFMDWATNAYHSDTALDKKTYDELAKPSTSSVRSYRLTDTSLYDTIVMKYMGHTMSSSAASDTSSDGATMDHSMMHMEGM